MRSRTISFATRRTTSSRIGISSARESASRREVPVEIVVNGAVVATQPLVADGTVRDLTFDVPIESQQLDRRADSSVVAHQSGVCARRRQADPRVAREPAVVPDRGQPVLDPEGAEDPRQRDRRGAPGLRPRASGVSAAPGGSVESGSGTAGKCASHHATAIASVAAAVACAATGWPAPMRRRLKRCPAFAGSARRRRLSAAHARRLRAADSADHQ